MPKDMKRAGLFDFYGDLLSEHQRDIFDLYYNEDLSLGEIAENAGITRQAVLGNLRKAEKNLELFEQKLGLSKRHERNEKIVLKMTELIKRSSDCDGGALLELINELSF